MEPKALTTVVWLSGQDDRSCGLLRNALGFPCFQVQDTLFLRRENRLRMADLCGQGSGQLASIRKVPCSFPCLYDRDTFAADCPLRQSPEHNFFSGNPARWRNARSSAFPNIELLTRCFHEGRDGSLFAPVFSKADDSSELVQILTSPAFTWVPGCV